MTTQGIIEDLDHLTANQIYKDIIQQAAIFKIKTDEKINTSINLNNTPNLSPIENFVGFIRSTNHIGYIRKDILSKEGIQSVTFRADKLSFYFSHINSYIKTVYSYDDVYIYSENVTLFLECCKELKLSPKQFNKPEFLCNADMRYEAELYNDLITLIRIKSKTEQFKKKLSNRKSNAVRMQKRLTQYVKDLFAVHSRLLVIRLDLGYYATADKNGVIQNTVTLEQVRKDFNKLFNNRRHNDIFYHMVGYISKLEFGGKKGFHYHLIFFFKGAHVHKGPYLGNKIGEYWSNVITAGLGSYFNCNANKSKYTHLGIGMINAESEIDAELRSNLNNYVLRYLTKSEQYLKVKLGEKDRVFSTGGPPKRTSSAGRPRDSVRDARALAHQLATNPETFGFGI